MAYRQPNSPRIAKKNGGTFHKWVNMVERIHQNWDLDLVANDPLAVLFRPPGNYNIDKPVGWAIVDKLHTLSKEYDGCGQVIVDDMTKFSMTRRV